MARGQAGRRGVVGSGSGAFKDKVCVCTALRDGGRTAVLVEYATGRVHEIVNRSGQAGYYTLEPSPSGHCGGIFEGPTPERINAMLETPTYTEFTTDNDDTEGRNAEQMNYSITTWRRAKVGDVILPKSGCRLNGRVCVVTKVLTLDQHTYGSHMYHDESASEVISYELHGQPDQKGNSYWNWSNSFDMLTPDSNGPYVGPDNHHDTGGNGTMNNPLTIKTAKIIEVLKGRLDEKKTAFDQAEADRVASEENAGKVFKAFLKAHPGTVQAAIEYRYGIKFSGHADLDSVETWFKSAGYSADLETYDAKIEITPAAEFPGDAKLEKLIRTLELAEDDTVEVSPTDDVYNLL